MLLGVPSPLVYTYLAGEVKAEDPTSLIVPRMQAYGDAEFCILTVLAFFDATQYGIDHWTTVDRCMRKPAHGGGLVGPPPAVHRGVEQFGLDAYFRPLPDGLVRAIAAYEANASPDWEAIGRTVEGRWPGQVTWAPWINFNWQGGIVHDVVPEKMAG